jgi:thiamine-monophosphate kinase
MSMGEFDLIERFFQRPARRAVLGVGDDCALIQPAAGQQLAISSDMLVEGRHFLSTVDPVRLGHKALAVNLSDLAACGATPVAFTLALALPRADHGWLEGFSRGLYRLADTHGCELIGGDTTQGPLTIAITVFGEVPPDQALLRHAAQVGDDIWVSGTLGDARLALEVFRGNCLVTGEVFERARARMECPTPRVELGQALRGVANAAIDVSDGLLGDLGHLLKRSGVGAQIDTAWVQGSAAVTSDMMSLPWPRRLDCVLAGGDDYELLFTAPVLHRERIHALASDLEVPVTRIGRITAESGLRVLDPQGQPINRRFASFDHFSA